MQNAWRSLAGPTCSDVIREGRVTVRHCPCESEVTQFQAEVPHVYLSRPSRTDRDTKLTRNHIQIPTCPELDEFRRWAIWTSLFFTSKSEKMLNATIKRLQCEGRKALRCRRIWFLFYQCSDFSRIRELNQNEHTKLLTSDKHIEQR